jgi:hypothetical protein
MLEKCPRVLTNLTGYAIIQVERVKRGFIENTIHTIKIKEERVA